MKLKIFILISLVILAGMGWWYARPRQMIVFCDVGQGDGAIVINGSWQMIIDAGPDNGKMAECLSRHMPFWDKEIETAIISHWDSDHSGGLNRIQQLYRINETYGGSNPNGDIEQIKYSGDLGQSDVIRAGEMQFEVKLPSVKTGLEISESNERSLVGLLKYGIYEILFTGDMTGDEERMMVWRDMLDVRSQFSDVRKTRILKVSHHGSGESTTEEFLNYWKPNEAVISVGAKNKFGHPKKDVLERLEKAEVKIRRTDKDGELIIRI